MTDTNRGLWLRSRSANGEPRVSIRQDRDHSAIGVVSCDTWNSTQCLSAARRVLELGPRINDVVTALRRSGALIVHAPAGCTDHQAGTPALGGAGAPPTNATESER